MMLDLEDEDLAESQPDRKPAWRMTPDERKEAAFERYKAKHTNYFAVIDAAGDLPPHINDDDERRELFMRRYEK